MTLDKNVILGIVIGIFSIIVFSISLYTRSKIKKNKDI